MTAVEYWNQTATFGYKFTFISSSAAALVSSPEPTVGKVGWWTGLLGEYQVG